jgi:tetratricopeptide (TPR) repeat protein
MKKIIVISAVLILASMMLSASIQGQLNEIDSLITNDRYEDAKALAEKTITQTNDNKDLSELYWRLSKITLSLADEEEALGATEEQLLAFFIEGEQYADKALELYESAPALIYKASNIGRWGETKGPLNALSKANPIKDTIEHVVNDLKDLDQTIGWYVIGQLYYQLPGWPISYGNNEIAVSVTRKAIDTIPDDKLYIGHFKGLASILWDRDWDAKKRNSKIKSMEKSWNKETSNIFEKHFYYEGSRGERYTPFYSSVPLNKMDDRQEAVMLLQYAINKYNAWPIHTRADKRSLEEIKELLRNWGY